MCRTSHCRTVEAGGALGLSGLIEEFQASKKLCLKRRGQNLETTTQVALRMHAHARTSKPHMFINPDSVPFSITFEVRDTYNIETSSHLGTPISCQ